MSDKKHHKHGDHEHNDHDEHKHHGSVAYRVGAAKIRVEDSGLLLSPTTNATVQGER